MLPRFAALIGLLAVLVPGSAAATDYFVTAADGGGLATAPFCADAGVDRAGCGSCQTPCATPWGFFLLGPGLDAGDTLYINAGMYLARTAADYITLTGSGAPDASVAIVGAPGPSAVLEANSVAPTCVWINGASYVDVSGIDCRHTANIANSPYGDGIAVEGASHDVALHDLAISASQHDGIRVQADLGAPAGPISLSNLVIDRSWDEGVYVAKNLSPVLLDHVISRLNGLVGIDVAGANAPVEIAFCTVHHNGTIGIGLYSSPMVNAHHNHLYLNGYDGIFVDCATCSVTGTDQIVNNTLENDLQAATRGSAELHFQACAPSVTLQVENNIAWLFNDAGAVLQMEQSCASGPLASDYNDLFASDGGWVACVNPSGSFCDSGFGDLAEYQGSTGEDSHSLSADPLFANPGTYDPHPLSSAGYLTGGTWHYSTNGDSPTLDRGDPNLDYAAEPFCNGGRVNLGSTGNSSEASRSANRCSLGFSTAPSALGPGQCSPPFTVAAIDVDGGTVEPTVPVAVTIAPNGSGWSFFSDPACTQALSSSGPDAGLSVTTFYAKSSATGSFTVLASSAGLLPAAATVLVATGLSDGGDAGLSVPADAGATPSYFGCWCGTTGGFPALLLAVVAAVLVALRSRGRHPR